MDKTYHCNMCNKIYESNTGLWLHNKKYHNANSPNNIKIPPNKNVCRYCNGQYACKQSRWKHEQSCKDIKAKETMLNDQVTDLKNQIKNMETTIKQQPLHNSINNNIVEKLTNKLCEKDLIINKLHEQNANNDFESPKFFLYELNGVLKINILGTIFEARSTDNYFNASQICGANNKILTDWLIIPSTNLAIGELQKNIDIQYIINQDDNIWMHPSLVLMLAHWISPILVLQSCIMLASSISTHNNMKKQIDRKESEICTLKNTFVKKHVGTNYPDKNVVYLITTKYHKKDRIYIVGKTADLKNRLNVYNKTCDHEVIYYVNCITQKSMGLIEQIILDKLSKFREVENRDRFILPVDKDISFFINIFDSVVNYQLQKQTKKSKTNEIDV